MVNRPCLKCGTPTKGTYCPAHKQAAPTYAEKQRRRALIEGHLQTRGPVCPGYGTPPHPSSDLTADHIYPRSRFGDTGGPLQGGLQVLCRRCNSRKHNH